MLDRYPAVIDHPMPPELMEMEDGLLTHEQYEMMKRHTRIWRDTLMLMLYRNTGFRPVEVMTRQARHVRQWGSAYYILVTRAKKGEKAKEEAVYLNPMLGQPLIEWTRGQNMRPADPLFGVKKRMMQYVAEETGMKAIGRPVKLKEFRRLYVRTVAQIAPQVVGYTPQHLLVAQRMVGHESIKTTTQFYWDLDARERREIQERIPV